MTFLRLATTCAVFDAKGHVLLSQRGDLGIWNLPGGRLDRGEILANAAAREVREETGIEAEIVRPVGLYYANRWARLTVLYIGRPVGGELLHKTDETRDNRFFSVDALPQHLYRPFWIDDARSGAAVLRVLETPLEEYRRIKRKLAWRWVKNLLNGRPEPRYPRFKVFARTVGGEKIRCDGDSAPWLQINQPNNVALHWVDTQQNLNADAITFVFQA